MKSLVYVRIYRWVACPAKGYYISAADDKACNSIEEAEIYASSVISRKDVNCIYKPYLNAYMRKEYANHLCNNTMYSKRQLNKVFSSYGDRITKTK